jgi:hypothetical protein
MDGKYCPGLSSGAQHAVFAGMPVEPRQVRRSTNTRRVLTYRGVTLQRPAVPPQTPLAVLEDAVTHAIQKYLTMLRASGADD